MTKRMFIILCTLIISMVIVSILPAATLKWDASADADGYNIYFTDGIQNFNYTVNNVTEVLDIDNTLNLHPDKTYEFYVTAYNQMGESGASNIAVYDTPTSYVAPENTIPIKLTKPSIITIIVE